MQNYNQKLIINKTSGYYVMLVKYVHPNSANYVCTLQITNV